MKDKMKPCPFCGETNCEEGTYWDTAVYSCVKCPTCQSSGPPVYETEDMIREMIEKKHKKSHCSDAAIRGWNERIAK